MTISDPDTCIIYEKDYNGKFELVISIRVDGVFVTLRPQKLDKIKKMINLKFTFQESGKVKKLLGVYYEWGQEEKVPYAKMTMDK